MQSTRKQLLLNFYKIKNNIQAPIAPDDYDSMASTDRHHK